MPKACFVTSVHFPFDTRVFYREALTLKKCGYDVCLIAQHTKEEWVDDIHIIPLPRFSNRAWRMIVGNGRGLILSLKQHADIYHLHDPELLPMGMLLKLLKKVVIYDCHEDYQKFMFLKEYIPGFLRKPISMFVEFIHRKSLKYFDYTIAATEDIENILRQSSGVARIVTITNFPELEYFEFDSKLKGKKDEFKVIQVGTLTEDRGIFQMVKAVEYVHSGIILILIGNFPDAEYRAKVMALPAFSSVRYLGYKGFKEAMAIAAQADVGLICFQPARQHVTSMPNKLFEYMALGLPVVASNFDLWRKIVEGNNCGLCVDPTRPEDIAQAINWLYEKTEMRRQYGENGKKAALKRFNWNREKIKFVELYEKLTKERT